VGCYTFLSQVLNNFFSMLALALLPVTGNQLGAAVAEIARAPRWVVGAALHAAAGVAIALVSVDLLPRVLDTTPMWLIVTLFSGGAVVSLLLVLLVTWIRRDKTGRSAGAWMVYVATLVDLFSDGLMTGASSAVSAKLGLLLGLSQVVANLPGGFATGANFRSQEVKRSVRLMAAASLVLPVIVSASIGFWVLRRASEPAQDAALAVIVGMLLVTTVEDLVPQADEPGTARWLSTTSFVAGFSFFAVLSTYFR
jgi:ZIP family zinc transporter